MPLSSFYDKTSTILTIDKTLIIEGAGTVLQFPLNFGEWTELKMGMFASIVSSTDANGLGPAESFVPSTPNSFFAFGVKDSSAIIPGLTGSTFLGMIPFNFTNAESISVSGNLRQLNISTGDGSSAFCPYWKDTTCLNGANNAATAVNSDPTIAGSYGFKLVLVLKVNNRGLATQTVQGKIHFVNSDPIAGGYIVNNLRSYFDSVAVAPATARAANNGSAAHAVPTTFYLRWPFTNNRLRISALAVQKYA